ncbi:MAG TPA: UDP-2,3-diacylglucosamine diphosphatase [Bacteroidia bacterium]|jgi:UDP-2,3-diacylglucosamine hydrolase|nr:UDP-2,3-diacylglucosamine diphosphatase [Bacteroidia bacterium]
MSAGKNIYFASDFHLGIPDRARSLERERRIVRWLEQIRPDTRELYLMGDVFDFWFEYKTVVPRGYVRLLAAIAAFTDAGIPVHYFTGNHDMWTFGYLEQELGVRLYRKPIEAEYDGKKFYIGHGDGLGPGDHGYKFIKKVFASPLCQWLFARLHPNFGIGVADYFSRKSRVATGTAEDRYLGDEQEWLVQYCKDLQQNKRYDYMIFGHRHLPLDMIVNGKGRYINLGDWIRYNTYAVFDGKDLQLKKFEG